MQHALSEYATPHMLKLWSPEWNVVAERKWWLRIVRWMRDNTRAYDHIVLFENQYDAYQYVTEDVDLDSIEEREQVTHHDVKARIEEFNWLAGLRLHKLGHPLFTPELIHWGMTSADVVDNISLIRMRHALDHLIGLFHYNPSGNVTRLMRRLPLRGIKGPVGTQQDMLELLGSVDACTQLDEHLADCYGFHEVLNSIGQVYPRSIDFDVAGTVHAAVQESGNKRPWLTIVSGYMNMISSYSGDQWNEGDVSTSAVRRVALPGLFLATDAALNGSKP